MPCWSEGLRVVSQNFIDFPVKAADMEIPEDYLVVPERPSQKHQAQTCSHPMRKAEIEPILPD